MNDENRTDTIRDLETYRDLRDHLNTLTDEQLDQPVQIFRSDIDGSPHPLHPAIAIGTVAEMFRAGDEAIETRSSADNDHHPESVVILADWNPFGLDGSMGEDILTGERLPTPEGVRNWEAKQ